jgi:hypothetical protein
MEQCGEKDVPLALSGWVNMMLQERIDEQEDQKRKEKEEPVLQYLMGLNLNTLLVLEKRCPLLATIMHEQSWWELLYIKWFPITYERLQQKPITANASLFLHQEQGKDQQQEQAKEDSSRDFYRDLWIAQSRWLTDLPCSGHVSHIPKRASIATAVRSRCTLRNVLSPRPDRNQASTTQDGGRSSCDGVEVEKLPDLSSRAP